MVTRRRYLRTVCAAGATGTAGCVDGSGGGPEGDADTETTDGADPGTPTETSGEEGGGGNGDALAFATSAFEDDDGVPEKFTCEGEDVSPPLSVGDVPDEVSSLAVVVDDPDAPGGTFIHWLLWDVPADVGEIPEGVPREETVADLDGAKQGTNDFGELGYRGPCPPEGDDPHGYRFTCRGLDESPGVDSGADRGTLQPALAERTVVRARFVGEFARE